MDAAKYILKNLATLHGVPLALKLKDPEVFKKKILPHINTVKLFEQLGDDIVNITVNIIDQLILKKTESQIFVQF